MAKKKKAARKRATQKSKASRTIPKPGNANGSTPPVEDQSGYAMKDAAVEDFLVSGEHRDLLETYFGEELYEDLRVLTTRSRSARVRGGPRVLILPGIMGSKLGRERVLLDDVIWIDPVDIIAGRLSALSLETGLPDIKALGVVLFAYLKIKLRLRLAGFDADFYPYDWRTSISTLGKQLAKRIRSETSSGQSELYLVAHSMGGLVSRAAIKQLESNNQDQKVRRLIMLGTPNYGSFSPVQALSGNHGLVGKVAALDLENSEEELVNTVFNTFPGLHEMLPARQRYAGLDLYDQANWPPTGFAPRGELLAAAPKLHDDLAAGRSSFALIAGINQDTIVGARRDVENFVFEVSNDGDGTVPRAFAELEDVPTYYVEEKHGSLPNNSDAIKAVIDLLERGQTEALPNRWVPQARGTSREVPAEDWTPVAFEGRRGKHIGPREIRHLLEEFAAPPKQLREERPPSTTQSLALSGEPVVVGRRRQQRIDLRLACGDLSRVDSRAIVLGHFRGVDPSGAARAIDEKLGGAISEFTERRMISASVGEIFIMPANRYRMGADLVVFAGMGTYDEFDDEVLRLVAENVARTLVRTKVDEFATVMLSSGIGMAMADVLANLMEGFLRGLAEGGQEGRLRGITLCEIDRRRFEQIHNELLRLTTTSLFDEIEATVEVLNLPPEQVAATPVRGSGQESVAGADPSYLIVREMREPNAEETDTSPNAPFELRASVLTAGANATVITDTIRVDSKKLNQHLGMIETNDFTFDELATFGSTLAGHVLPPLVQRALYGTRNRQLVVIHDSRSSRIPWETIRIDDWFPAAEAGLSRKYEAEDLAVAKWLEERRLESDLSVLLIVNPTLDLPGAAREGKRIKKILANDPTVRVDELRGRQATFSAVRAAFRSGKYDVIHYAGHAFFDPNNRVRSGIVCHGGQVLSGVELTHLEKLPAVVFFNACEAGRIRSAKAIRGGRETAKRLETNVGLAEALLRAGIGNYIGTYWPVMDQPAKTFGEIFYREILKGSSVSAAVNSGRQAVKEMEEVDWADYIHYGSPNFVVKRSR